MSRHVLSVCLLVWGFGAVATRSALGQTTSGSFAQGIRAYQDLDFGRAAATLRRDLARLNAAGAPAADQVQGLVYLGAADLFRGRRDSAVVVFRRLVQLDPRYAPDRLVFPPEVTTVFDSVRALTKTVAVVVPPDTQVAPGTGNFSALVLASAFQTVDVTLRYEDGTPFRSLYVGPIGDSLHVQWDGLDAAGQLPPVSRILLRVASRAPSGEISTILQVPLDLRIARQDTLAWPTPPPASAFLPERAGGRSALRALLGGAVLSGAVIALPSVVGGSGGPSGSRVAVAGSVGIAGVLGYLLHRPGRPLPANIRANQTRRDAWQQAVATATAENARRRGDVRLAVHAGPATAIQARSP
ncbi:MAG TPA: hypothetical protein VGV12_16340 [Gemmatimonadales bacterium]|nr:hypothetical protein [Gemmatimonadales bacterium]